MEKIKTIKADLKNYDIPRSDFVLELGEILKLDPKWQKDLPTAKEQQDKIIEMIGKEISTKNDYIKWYKGSLEKQAVKYSILEFIQLKIKQLWKK